MSKIITEREIVQNSNTSDATGISVFGHAQVADTFLAWCAMSRQERRVLATKLATYDAPAADEFAQMIIDAVFDTGYHDGLMTAPEPGSERYERIQKMLRSVMAESDGNDPQGLEI